MAGIFACFERACRNNFFDFDPMLKTCGSLSAGADVESSGQPVKSLRHRSDHIRLLIAFVVSLSLHLAAIAFLIAFVPLDGVIAGRLGGFSNAPLIVNIAKPEKVRQPAVSPYKQPASLQAPRNSKAQFATQSFAQDAIAIALPGLYFSTSELDIIPEIRHDIDLYPSELQNLKHGGGKVVLRLWIDETGRVENVEPVSSDLPTDFTEVAALVFMQADFLPGKKKGFAVKSKVDAVLVYPKPDEP